MRRAIPSPIPHGRTARRLEWAHLPPAVRSEIEQRCGSPVVSAVSQGGGYTPGFASVLTCADGSRHFVKAASTAAQRTFAASYREEARKLRALPDTIPAPHLLWSLDGDWVVLGLEYVEARAPRRPWRPEELDACLDTLETVASLLTPSPPGLGLDSITDELAAWPAFWEHSLILLIGPRGDGLDVEAVMTERRLLREAPPEDVDRTLAVLCGYFLRSADEPVPPSSPHLRDVQRWQGEVVWDWLSERRGW
jgi:hypothetical protein